jgi:hypothetical protein
MPSPSVRGAGAFCEAATLALKSSAAKASEKRKYSDPSSTGMAETGKMVTGRNVRAMTAVAFNSK